MGHYKNARQSMAADRTGRNFSTCAVGSHNQAAQCRHGLALNWNLRCKILLFKSPFFTKASICFGLDVLRLLMSNMPHKMLMYGAL